MQQKFQQVKLGMCKEDVTKLVGEPDDTREVPFGGEVLTAWVYRKAASPVSVWFDRDGKLRLKK
jgi:hypothetical protein